MAKSPSSPAPTPRLLPLYLSILALLVSVIASGSLVYKHYFHLALPGCGPQSACDAATSSLFGAIPLPGSSYTFPVSHLGFAYFAALLLGTFIARHAYTRYHHWVVRLGVLASLFFISVLFINKHLCPYCLAAHAGNILYWLLGETSSSTSSSRRSSFASIIATLAFLAIAAALAATQFASQRSAILENQRLARQSTQQIINASQPAITTQPDPAMPPFTGRYRLGPESAPIRVVVISDFQCPDCRNAESELRALFEANPGKISLSAKHFPMCAACNPAMNGQTIHPNACWAARAAETAGILHGNDGFWKMHRWLFDHAGSFTDQSFPNDLLTLGFNPAPFIQTMQSQQTLDLVKADCLEAQSLGIFFTPMILINGVEFRGWATRGALTTSINTLLQANLPALTAAADQPVPSAQKYIGDWRENPPVALRHLSVQYSLGPSRALAPVHVWGDYNDPNSQKLDSAIRAFIAAHPGRHISYTFHHYPFDKSCNPNIDPRVTSPFPPTSCLAARAAFAAGSIANDAGYWRIHQWLFANAASLTSDSLRAAAPSLQLDPAALLAAINAQPVSAALSADIAAGRAVNPKGFIPLLYINDKWVPRWEHPDLNILDSILLEASAP